MIAFHIDNIHQQYLEFHVKIHCDMNHLLRLLRVINHPNFLPKYHCNNFLELLYIFYSNVSLKHLPRFIEQ